MRDELDLAFEDEADRFDFEALTFDEDRFDFTALDFDDEERFAFEAFARRAALAFDALQLARARFARRLLPRIALLVQRTAVGFGRVQPL